MPCVQLPLGVRLGPTVPTLSDNKGTKREKLIPPHPASDWKTLCALLLDAWRLPGPGNGGAFHSVQRESGISPSGLFSAPWPADTKVLLGEACFSFPTFSKCKHLAFFQNSCLGRSLKYKSGGIVLIQRGKTLAMSEQIHLIYSSYSFLILISY